MRTVSCIILYIICLSGVVSGKRGSNPRPPAWEASALPTELLPQSRAYIENKYGADTRTRTGDPRITNALLYQLSHIGFYYLLKCDAKVSFFFLYCKFIQPFLVKNFLASVLLEPVAKRKYQLMMLVAHLLAIAEVIVSRVIFILISINSI